MQCSIAIEALLQQVLYKVLLSHAESNDTDAVGAQLRVADAAHHLINYCPGFVTIGALTALVVHALHLHQSHLGTTVVGRRECDEFAVVIFIVGECNKRFVARAIVPVELKRWYVEHTAVLEDALKVVDLRLVFSYIR